jgi:hypothetical protein
MPPWPPIAQLPGGYSGGRSIPRFTSAYICQLKVPKGWGLGGELKAQEIDYAY